MEDHKETACGSNELRSNREFDKFYRNGEYSKWNPDDQTIVSRKTMLWWAWNAGWVAAYKEGREELAASLCRELHKNMGKKKIIVMDD